MSPPESAAARTKAGRAHDAIRGRILAREYSPGYRLVLSRLAVELDMSVVPVREAIRRLEAEGLVTFEANVGAHVAMIDDTQYRHSMQTLAFLEGTATALAARVMTAQDIAMARTVNEQLVHTLEDFDPHTFTALNQQFHTLLFGTCPNPRMLDLVRTEWRRLGSLRDSTFAFVPGRARDSVREHEDILRLIEGSAPLLEIEDAVRRHRHTTLDAYDERRRAGADGVGERPAV